MADALQSNAPTRGYPLRVAALVAGIAAILLALSTTTIAALLEGLPVFGRGFVISDDEISRTASFGWLTLSHFALGLLATTLAIAAYLSGGLGRMGRVALVLGIIAMAWKYVLLALVIAVAIAFLFSLAS